MPKKMSKFAQDILKGLEEANAYVQGKSHRLQTTDYTFANAKAIRERLGMSQSEFSRTYGIPLDTLQNWEQGRNHPDRTASAYLWTIEDFPKQASKAQKRHRNLSGAEAMAL